MGGHSIDRPRFFSVNPNWIHATNVANEFKCVQSIPKVRSDDIAFTVIDLKISCIWIWVGHRFTVVGRQAKYKHHIGWIELLFKMFELCTHFSLIHCV